MKQAEYKLAGTIPEVLRGRTVKTPEAETTEEFLTLVKDGNEDHMRRLAQGGLDIIRQRKIREFCESEEVAAALAGKTVKWDDTDEVQYGEFSEDERVSDILDRAQEVGNAYVYGSQPAGTGTGKVTKAKAAQLDKAVEAAKNDPALAAKLAALGISI